MYMYPIADNYCNNRRFTQNEMWVSLRGMQYIRYKRNDTQNTKGFPVDE